MPDTEHAADDHPSLKYMTAEQRHAPGVRYAGPGTTYPIRPEHPEDVRHAWDLAGHADNPDQVRANVRRIAHELGMESALPDTAKEDGNGKAAAGEIERKSLDFEVKDMAEAGNGSAVVRFAAFNNIDRANEIIEPGAFKSLDVFLRDGFIARGHDWSALPIGMPTSAVQDDRGLLVGFDFHSTPEAQAARTVMKERMAAGKSVKGSIGYEVTDDAIEDRGGSRVRLLKGITLHECSLVNVPCNPMADAVAVKGIGLKAGRAISRANHALMSGHAEAATKAMSDAMACMKDLSDVLARHAPTPSDPDGDGDDDSSPSGDTDRDYAGKSAGAPAPTLPPIHDKVAIPGAVAAPTLADRSARLVADAAELTGLYAKAADQRRADGRTLAPAKRAQIRAAAEALLALHAATEPPPDPAEAEKAARLKFLRLKHQSQARRCRRAGA